MYLFFTKIRSVVQVFLLVSSSFLRSPTGVINSIQAICPVNFITVLNNFAGGGGTRWRSWFTPPVTEMSTNNNFWGVKAAVLYG
jgi:hypothetical protein